MHPEIRGRIFPRRAVKPRGRAALVRKLVLEKLEPRSLLAADVLVPSDLPLSKHLETDTGAGCETPAEVVTASSRDRLNSPADAMAGDLSSLLTVERGGNEDSGRAVFAVGDIVQLEFRLPTLSPFLNSAATELAITIHYNAEQLQLAGSLVVEQSGLCHYENILAEGVVGVRLRLADALDDEIVIKAELQIVGPGTSNIAVNVLGETPEGGVGTTELWGGTSWELTAGNDFGSGATPADPNDQPTTIVRDIPFTMATPATTSSDRAGLIQPRALLPRRDLADADEARLMITLTIRTVSPGGEQERTLMAEALEEIRRHRRPPTWSLTDDATAILWHPLQGETADELTRGHEGRRGLLKFAAAAARQEQPATEESTSGHVQDARSRQIAPFIRATDAPSVRPVAPSHGVVMAGVPVAETDAVMAIWSDEAPKMTSDAIW